MQQPQQRRFESQSFQANATTPRCGLDNTSQCTRPIHCQDQGQGNEEESQLGIACAGLDACLVQLSEARLDSEALAIGVGHPAHRSGLDAPVRIDPGESSMLLPRFPVVAAIHRSTPSLFSCPRPACVDSNRPVSKSETHGFPSPVCLPLAVGLAPPQASRTAPAPLANNESHRRHKTRDRAPGFGDAFRELRNRHADVGD